MTGAGRQRGTGDRAGSGALRGCPASLHWYEGFEGAGAWSLELDTGNGADLGLRRRAEAREAVRRTVAGRLGMIGAMDRLSEDWRDRAAFDALHRLAAGANAAY